MSRPPGPPPYTAAQIASLATPTEKFIAQAELNSYVAGHRLADKRERELEASHSKSGWTDGATHGKYTDGPSARTNNIHGGAHHGLNGFARPGPRSMSDAGPVRSNSWRGGAHGLGAGHGYGGFQPYPQPQYARGKFSNRSAIFTPSSMDNEQPHGRKSKQQAIKSTTLCPAFISTGKCTRPGCPDVHDASKQSLCKRWLYKDDCLKGDFCQLSHRTTPENAPTCMYFLDGRCNNDRCLFAHVRVDQSALVCEAFGRLGYCEKGDKCAELHIHACPDFANTGTCPAGKECTLRHVHDGSRLRAAAGRSSESQSPSAQSNQTAYLGASQDGTTDNEANTPMHSHAISQQHDYVPFDFED